MSNPLENQLLRENQIAANQFTGETYQDVLDWFEEKGRSTASSTNEFRIHQIEQALAGLEQDANGHYYNGNGERVYVYRDSSELGDDSGGFTGENIVMRTEQEIRDAWNADQGMGYFQEANPHLSADDYIGFVSALDEMYASGQLTLNKHDELYAHREIGRGPNSDVFNEILLEEAQRVKDYESQVVSTIMGAWGIEDTFVNDDGDVFRFNGSNYTKTYKVDDHLGVGDYVKMGAGVLMSVYAGPLLASSMSGFMSAGLAKAASSAIISQATALMNGQGLSLEDALMSAATSYGGSALTNKLGNTGIFNSLTDKVNALGNAAFDGGGAVLNSALQAGGMSLVTQLVKSGKIDWKDAGIAAAMAGGTTALTGYLSDIGRNNDESLQEIVVTAKRVGTEVGPGLYELNGIVFSTNPGPNYGYVGNMSEIDTDGDGRLSGSDLQNITTNNQYAPSSIGYQDNNTGRNSFKEGGTYYISEDGVVHQRDDVKYLDGGPNGTYLVRDARGNEFYVRDATFGADGRFTANGNFVAVNGYYDAERNMVYSSMEQYTSANGITDNTGNQITPTYGQNPNWSSDSHYMGSTYGTNDSGYIVESPIYWSLETGYYTKDANGAVVSVNPETLPEEIKKNVEETQDNSDDSSPNSENANTGNSGNPGGTPSSSTSASSNYTAQQILAMANAASATVQEVIKALDSGATPEQVVETLSASSNNNNNSNNNTSTNNNTSETPATEPAPEPEPEPITKKEQDWIDSQHTPISGTPEPTPVEPPPEPTPAPPKNSGWVDGAWTEGTDDQDYKTGVKPNSGCPTGWSFGNGACIPADSPHKPNGSSPTPYNPNASQSGGGNNSSTSSGAGSTGSGTTGNSNTGSSGTGGTGTGTGTGSGSSTGSGSTGTGSGSASSGSGTGNGTEGQGNGNGTDEGPGGNGSGGNGSGLGGMGAGMLAGMGGGVPFTPFDELNPGYQFKARHRQLQPPQYKKPVLQQRVDSIYRNLWKEVMK